MLHGQGASVDVQLARLCEGPGARAALRRRPPVRSAPARTARHLVGRAAVLRQRQRALVDVSAVIVKVGRRAGLVMHERGVAAGVVRRRDVARRVDRLLLLLELVRPVARDAHAALHGGDTRPDARPAARVVVAGRGGDGVRRPRPLLVRRGARGGRGGLALLAARVLDAAREQQDDDDHGNRDDDEPDDEHDVPGRHEALVAVPRSLRDVTRGTGRTRRTLRTPRTCRSTR